jgi:hypothetical protein
MVTQLLSLAIDAHDVVALRILKLASGGADAIDELRLMYSEKMLFAVTASTGLLSGDTIFDVVDQISERVARNRIRLAPSRS